MNAAANNYANNIDNIDTEEMSRRYEDYIYKGVLYYSRMGAILAYILVPAFICLDFLVFRVTLSVLYFRLVPLVIALCILILRLGRGERFIRINRALYHLFMVSLMVMISGVVAISVESYLYEASILGMLIVIFAIFLGFRGRIVTLMALLIAPIAALTVYLIFYTSAPLHRIGYMAMPMTIIFVIYFVASSQERLRYQRFKSSVIIEHQNVQLQNSYQLIDQRNRQMYHELTMARSIQHHIIPMVPPIVKGAEFYSAYLPIMEVGGDLFDYIQLPGKDRIGIFISDVSGHGVPAALITSMIKTLINTAGDEKLHCAQFLQYINEKISGMTAGNFITAFYGVYDSSTRIFTYARGGHCYPLLVRGHREIIKLQSHGKFMGQMRGLTFEEKEVKLEKGDKLLFYTDGLVETENEFREEFEMTLVRDILVQNSHQPIDVFVQSIVGELFEFSKNGIINDDICIVGMEVT